jgi:hypothetical protein
MQHNASLKDFGKLFANPFRGGGVQNYLHSSQRIQFHSFFKHLKHASACCEHVYATQRISEGLWQAFCKSFQRGRCAKLFALLIEELVSQLFQAFETCLFLLSVHWALYSASLYRIGKHFASLTEEGCAKWWRISAHRTRKPTPLPFQVCGACFVLWWCTGHYTLRPW